MPVFVIDTLKPKNGLDFPVVEAIDVAVEGYSSLADAVTHFATNAMIEAINTALSGKANTLDVNSAVADLQAQINQIEISASAEAVVAPEVTAARVGADGTSYQTLKTRLDTENNIINTALSQLKSIETHLTAATAFWEDGIINTYTGVVSASDVRIASGFIETSKLFSIECESTYTALLYAYDSTDAFLGWWNGSEIVTGSGSNPYYSKTINTLNFEGLGIAKIKICVANGERNIDAAEGIHVFKRNVGNAELERVAAVAAENTKNINSISSEIYDSTVISAEAWEQGTYNTSSGEESPTQEESHIRAVVPNNGAKIQLNTGYYAVIYCYTLSETYLGWWNGSEFIKGSGAEAYTWAESDLNAIKKAGASILKVVLRKSDGSNITPAQSGNLILTTSDILQLKAQTAVISSDLISISRELFETKAIDGWEQGMYNTYSGEETTAFAETHLRVVVPKGSIEVSVPDSYAMVLYAYSSDGYIGWWNGEEYKEGAGAESYIFTSFNLSDFMTGNVTELRIVLRKVNGGNISVSDAQNAIFQLSRIDEIEPAEAASTLGDSALIDTQKKIAKDWYIPFVDVMELGMGNNHIIPETAKTWNPSGTRDLTQNEILMSDGVHPSMGNGVVKAYGITIANQFSRISPFYYQIIDEKTSNFWNGKSMIWFGTSIPAGSDPTLGVQGEAYPAYVGELLGATVTNQARGSSCVRINASGGNYKGMIYNHFLRSLSRTIDECDVIAENWESIQPLISGAPATLSAEDLATMKAHSFENLLLPYLDGTNNMPDVFVLDHGFNDRRPLNASGDRDFTLNPTVEQINKGNLAADEYMTDNNYANLKTALNSQLTGISDLETFATSLNRYTYIGAMNFIITLILRYNPQARIVIVSSYIT